MYSQSSHNAAQARQQAITEIYWQMVREWGYAYSTTQLRWETELIYWHLYERSTGMLWEYGPSPEAQTADTQYLELSAAPPVPPMPGYPPQPYAHASQPLPNMQGYAPQPAQNAPPYASQYASGYAPQYASQRAPWDTSGSAPHLPPAPSTSSYSPYMLLTPSLDAYRPLPQHASHVQPPLAYQAPPLIPPACSQLLHDTLGSLSLSGGGPLSNALVTPKQTPNPITPTADSQELVALRAELAELQRKLKQEQDHTRQTAQREASKRDAEHVAERAPRPGEFALRKIAEAEKADKDLRLAAWFRGRQQQSSNVDPSESNPHQYKPSQNAQSPLSNAGPGKKNTTEIVLATGINPVKYVPRPKRGSPSAYSLRNGITKISRFLINNNTRLELTYEQDATLKLMETKYDVRMACGPRINKAGDCYAGMLGSVDNVNLAQAILLDCQRQIREEQQHAQDTPNHNASTRISSAFLQDVAENDKQAREQSATGSSHAASLHGSGSTGMHTLYIDSSTRVVLSDLTW